MFIQQQPIILSSKSPRRQELLTSMGLDFSIDLKDVDESYPPNLSPAEIAMFIADQKAKAFGDADGKIIITADTIVAINGDILGKPVDKADAQRMLRQLAGTRHEVYTGVSILTNTETHTFYDLSEVYCRQVSDEEINFYIDNFQPFDKAGSYGIQDWWGLTVVKRIEGSYTNVMGLPTEKLYEALLSLG